MAPPATDLSVRAVGNDVEAQIVEQLNILLAALDEPAQRRERLQRELAKVQREMLDLDAATQRRRVEIEAVRARNEKMTSVVGSIGQLKQSLEEHMRVVRQNEGSLAGAGAILEYDEARRRADQLIQLLQARQAWGRAVEAVQDERDDPTKLLTHLHAMQHSMKTLSLYDSTAAQSTLLEQLKDEVLQSRSGELESAFLTSNVEQIAALCGVYELLSRTEEFGALVSRQIESRVRAFSTSVDDQEGADDVPKIVDDFWQHVTGVFRDACDTYSSLPATPQSLIEKACLAGIENVDLRARIEHALSSSSSEDRAFELLGTLVETCGRHSVTANKAGFLGLSNAVDAHFLAQAQAPLAAALTSRLLAHINALELTLGPFRKRVDQLKSGVAELLTWLAQILDASLRLYDDRPELVARQPVEKALDNLASRLKAWEYWTDSKRQPRGEEDLYALLSFSGQLVGGMADFRRRTQEWKDIISLDMRTLSRWNKTACERTLRAALAQLLDKLERGVESTRAKLSSVADGSTPASTTVGTQNLPSFALAPSEYMTTCGQELLGVLHRTERALQDASVLQAFHVMHKSKFAEEELVKRVLAGLASRVVETFLEVVGDAQRSSDAAFRRQIEVDAGFLRDALDDLVSGGGDAGRGELDALLLRLRTARAGS